MSPPTLTTYLEGFEQRKKLRAFNMMPRERFHIYYIELKLGRWKASKVFKSNVSGMSCTAGAFQLAEVLFNFGVDLYDTVSTIYDGRISKLWVEP